MFPFRSLIGIGCTIGRSRWMRMSSSGSCQILRNLRGCGTGRSRCGAVSSFGVLGFGYRLPLPLHPSDPAPTSVCIMRAFFGKHLSRLRNTLSCVRPGSSTDAEPALHYVCVSVRRSLVPLLLAHDERPGGYGRVLVSVAKAPCHRTVSRRITRFGLPQWRVALGVARMKGSVVACTSILITLRVLLNVEQNMYTTSSRSDLSESRRTGRNGVEHASLSAIPRGRDVAYDVD